MLYNTNIFNFKILDLYTSYLGDSVLIIILLCTTFVGIYLVNILLTEEIVSPIPQAEEFIKWLDGLTPEEAIERLQKELDDMMKHPITQKNLEYMDILNNELEDRTASSGSDNSNNGDSDDSDKKSDNSDKKESSSDKKGDSSDKNTEGSDKKTV